MPTSFQAIRLFLLIFVSCLAILRESQLMTRLILNYDSTACDMMEKIALTLDAMGCITSVISKKNTLFVSFVFEG